MNNTAAKSKVIPFPDRDDISARKAAQFITRIWEDQPGKYFFIGTARRGKVPSKGTPFTRDQFGEIEAFIKGNDHLNIWWIVYGCSTAERKGSHVEPRWLYSDLDNVDPDDMLVKPTILYETSPGSFAGLWKMDKPVSFEFNKRLSYAHGADSGAWSRSKFLRVPFTVNRKVSRKDPTVRVRRNDGPEYTRASMEKALGVWARVSEQGMSYIWTKPGKEHSDTTKSEKLRAAECRLVEEEFSDDEIVELLTDSHWNKFRENEQRLREDIARARKHVEAKGGVKRRPARVQPDFFGLHDLENEKFTPLKWIVPNVLPEGLGIFAGRPKKGKSWIGLDWACAVASGSQAFGEIKCSSGDVLWLPLEDNKRRLKKRTKLYLQGRPWPKRIAVSLQWPRIGEGCEDEIRKWAKSVKNPRLAIIDTYKRVKPKREKESGYDIDSDDLEGLQKLAGELRICILVVHHTRKMIAEDPFDGILGSTGLMAVVDAAFVLQRNRGSNDARFFSTGRDIEEELDKKLLWNGRFFEICGEGETDEECAKAELFLREMLQKNPMKAKEVEKLAAGTHAERTLRRAREKVCARPYRKDNASWWKLK